jgi:hypothetical protein
MKKIILLATVLLSFKGFSQSNPTPFNLETGGTYTFTNWAAASAASTYPSNMIFHTLANANSTLAAATASSNVTGVYNNAGATTRMNGLDAGGFSFRNSPTTPDITGYVTRRLGEAVLAVNTTNRTNIKVSWKAGEIGTASPVYGITCQYRIGTSGPYTAMPGALSSSQYLSTNVSSSVSFGPITLPSTCDNQSVVQIRWAYTYVSGATGTASPQLFVDDISVSSIPLVTLSPLPNTCNLAPSFLLTDGQPAGGIYSGIGVIGNSFDPAISGSGIQTITYTYTDVNGFSNFATTPIDVNPSYCITTTSLTPVSCGATGLDPGDLIFCETVFGATNYEFTITNTSLGYSATAETGTPVYPSIRLSKFPGLLYGTTYDVTVRAKVGGFYGASSLSCQITLIAFPSTSLNGSSCNATGLTTSSYIYCNTILGSTEYEFTISNSSLAYSSVKTSPYAGIHLTKFSGLQYGVTYDVAVRAKIGTTFGPAGTVCQITLMAFPSTSLNGVSCGATGLLYSSYLNCIPVFGATNYEYTVTNSSIGYSQVKYKGTGHAFIKLNIFKGLLPSTTYDVSVKAYVGGVWGPSGAVCSITTASTFGLLEPNFSDLRAVDSNDNIVGSIKLFPNPISKNSTLTIELPENESVIITISDLLGRQIFERNYNDINSFEIQLSELTLDEGIYNVTIINGRNIQNQKLVIVK